MSRSDKRGGREAKKPKAPKPDTGRVAPGYVSRSAEITVGRSGRPLKPSK
jgi:hypothetical protein